MSQAATLSQRYVSERKQPDKAIDLVDEAASRLRLQQESKPEPIWRLEKDVLTKEIELAALDRDLSRDSGPAGAAAARASRIKLRLLRVPFVVWPFFVRASFGGDTHTSLPIRPAYIVCSPFCATRQAGPREHSSRVRRSTPRPRPCDDARRRFRPKSPRCAATWRS